MLSSCKVLMAWVVWIKFYGDGGGPPPIPELHVLNSPVLIVLTLTGPGFFPTLKDWGGGGAKWPIAITPVFQVR